MEFKRSFIHSACQFCLSTETQTIVLFSMI
jgi:hypothetical protein